MTVRLKADATYSDGPAKAGHYVQYDGSRILPEGS